MMCMSIFALTSCTDGNDWSVDSAFDRLFGSADISIDAGDTYANVTFDTYKGVEKYIIEVSTDSLYADEVSTTSMVDTAITSPYKIEGLQGDTRYYLRMKSVATGENDSKWKYYKTSSGKYSFKTNAEQIFSDISDADRGEDSIHLAWTPTGTKVTNLKVMTADSTVIQDNPLDAAAIANGTYTVTGLSASTTYIFKIYNNTVCRGTISASTTAAMPAANYKYILPVGTTELTQDMLDNIAVKAQQKAGNTTNYSATIGIPGGSKLEVYSLVDGVKSNLKIPDGMSVTFFGLAGTKPELDFDKNIDIAGSHSFINFNNVRLADSGSEYFINQSAACCIGTFTLESVEAANFSKAFFRLQQTSTKDINTLIIKNSVFHDMCSGYAFVHVDANSGSGVIHNINISYSTFYNIAPTGKMFIYSNKTNMNSLVIDHITMFNSIGSGNYLIDFNKGYGVTNTFTISNSIFSKQPDNVTKNTVRSTLSPTVINCYMTNDYYKDFGETQYNGSATDVFEDPAKYNFNIKISNLNGSGDTYNWTSKTE